jgi:hypothetical protein
LELREQAAQQLIQGELGWVVERVEQRLLTVVGGEPVGEAEITISLSFLQLRQRLQMLSADAIENGNRAGQLQESVERQTIARKS